MSDDISIPHPGPLPARTSFTHSYRARRTGMDENTKRLLIAAAGLALLLLAGVGAWSMMGRRPATIPVIEADTRPLRVKPENPGGMQVVGADERVAGGVDTMGPGAESPDPQALRAQTLPRTSPAAPPAAPTTTAPATAALAPAVAQAVPPVSAPSTVSPLPDTPTRTVARPPTPVPHSAAIGGTSVQIAALDSEAAAKTEWQRLAKRNPDLLGGHEPVIQRTERDGKTFWRVRLPGFADAAEATAFCARLRAKGGACSLASF